MSSSENTIQMAEKKKSKRKYILLPLSKLYGVGTALRNKFFDWGIKRQHSFDIPIISVGNLAVGGTGKTPHTEYLVDLLHNDFKIGILSRGYKRKTRGFVLADDTSTPRDIGDEPYQMYRKFDGRIMVAVCENRAEGIRRMQDIDPDLGLIILDDAFQHRQVKVDVSILLTEWSRPYFEDRLLPYGRLRESTKGVVRADIVVVTKCPNAASPINYRIMASSLHIIPDQGPFFTAFDYEPLMPVFPDSVAQSRVPHLPDLSKDYTLLAVCGIGNPRPFLKYVKDFEPRVLVNVFDDHHDFNANDMQTLMTRFETMPRGRRYIVTTEKDAVRLRNSPHFPKELKPYIFFIPIKVAIEDAPQQKLKNKIMRLIRTKKMK